MLVKKYFLSIFVGVLFLFCMPISVSAESAVPEVSAQSAVVYCVNNAEVLFAKNAETKRSMASTTKIMTALLTLEAAAEENKPVTITKEMVSVEGSSMGLKDGDVLRLRELAIGMLMVSGNDAANAAAIAVGGSRENFAAKMNTRAAELGMTNTNFVTPSGLDDDNHYTTALDMAKLGAAAISNSDFLDICRQTSMNVSFENPRKTVTLANHNRLLKRYDGCIGVKTGFTKKSGRCLVSAAERDGIVLVAVTLSAPDDWNDHQTMLDYGFSQVEYHAIHRENLTFSVSVAGGVMEQVEVTVPETQKAFVLRQGQNVEEKIDLPNFVYAPITTGDVLGRVTYFVDGEAVQTLPLAATADVERIEQGTLLQRIGRWLTAIFL